jgi:hypothetical protein
MLDQNSDFISISGFWSRFQFQVLLSTFLSWTLNVQADTIFTHAKIYILKDTGPLQIFHMWLCLCLIACCSGNINVYIHPESNFLNFLKCWYKCQAKAWCKIWGLCMVNMENSYLLGCMPYSQKGIVLYWIRRQQFSLYQQHAVSSQKANLVAMRQRYWAWSDMIWMICMLSGTSTGICKAVVVAQCNGR